MTIDIHSERLVPLGAVPRLGLIPARRRGSRLHVATVHRWALRGLRGVRLETVQVGAQRCTSVEALGRFFERAARQREAGAAAKTTAPANPAHQERVEAELDRLGL